MQKIIAADLFCGAGGLSEGLACACQALGLDVELTAINHWAVAIATHAKNHPWAKHLCADLANVDPNKAIAGGHLHILGAGPECVHHSNARGGRPRSDQSRASAWHVLHWAERLYVDNILIENVREFQSWGPLGKDGRPLKRRKGETFNAFIKALESLGFNVDFRVLNSADFGDATVRRRLFIQARRGADPVWPEMSHSGHWRPAREIIDWNLKGASIFNRKRPLADRTLSRIEAGLRKFGGESFIAVLRGRGDWGARSIDNALPTITAGGTHLGLVSPFLVNMKGQSNVASVDQPTPTVTTREHLALCQPFIVKFDDQRQDDHLCATSIDKPLSTITTKAGHVLCEPFIVTVNHGEDNKTGGPESRVHSVDEPLGTITTCKSQALCEPFLVDTNHGGGKRHGSAESRTHPVDQPLDVITTHNGKGLVEPFLVKYFRTGIAKPVSEPLDTVTTKPRFGLVEPTSNGYQLDIRFRMLQPSELAAAMSLENYEFTGTKEQQVIQIGNAVARRTAEALCKSILRGVKCQK